jgi:hypothetical protein
VELADALHEMKMVYEKPAAKEMGEQKQDMFTTKNLRLSVYSPPRGPRMIRPSM